MRGRKYPTNSVKGVGRFLEKVPLFSIGLSATYIYIDI